ncbi:signal recognition particle-docking protein FtsY [Chelativorans sp. Marseille-P2723]|uniref:signal recognition particle-docking protein FtsY n=1 Tax=Chelativorans sp. Marseille-P2723 TaxID=2709133 RepID=UPI00156F9233|nr:signal recognition particle-docking protein FtsY [Chelativorans sp. Marseille-P2723]
MALGFIKKVFSFGKKEVEKQPEESAAQSELVDVAAPQKVHEPLSPAPLTEDPAALSPSPKPEEQQPETQALVEHPESLDAPAEAFPPEIPQGVKPEADVSQAPDADEAQDPPSLSLSEDRIDAQHEDEGKGSTPLPADLTPSAEPSTMEGTDEEEAAAAVEQEKEASSSTLDAEEPPKPWFQRLREGLSRSSRDLRENIASIFLKRKLDEDTLQDLEDVLLRADLGLETAMSITDALSTGRYGKDISGAEVQAVMAEEIEKVLAPVAQPLELDLSVKPHVILVVGVNGTGKTTTIGKLAAKLRQGGLSVMLAAGDTFRAAAIEQLKIWGERTGSAVVASRLGADAAGLAYDAFEKAKAAGSDVLIIDTAGRLQNRTELMAELEKIVRVLQKHDPQAPHTVLQTLDATTGQNALNQVEIFRNVAGVSGLVMTKLDGTARGGILVAIAAKHKLPVYFIGVGEGVDDLEPFSAGDFAKAIAGVQ